MINRGGEANQRRPFNPLHVPNVALTLALEVLEQNIHPFPPLNRFSGIGIYVIYYFGSFEPYIKLSELNKKRCVAPIYIGKGVRNGTRKGHFDFKSVDQTRIYERLTQQVYRQ